MKFDLASDLHINHYAPFKWDIMNNPDVDTLIIAGDTSNGTESAAEFLKDATNYYKNVAYVSGNHCHYQVSRYLEDRKSVSENENYLFAKSMQDNWTYLPFRDLIVDDVAIIGRNGWYSWNTGDVRYNREDYRQTWKEYMSDSRLIKFDTDEPDGLAENDAKALSDKVLQYDKDDTIKSIVMMTHTIPIIEALTVKEELTSSDIIWNRLGASFYNHYMEAVPSLSNKVKMHCFGHTHYNWDVVKGNTRYICNPKGYPSEPNAVSYRFKTIEI
jgi:hypothetical protein